MHLSETSVPALLSSPVVSMCCSTGAEAVWKSLELAQAASLRTNSGRIKKFSLSDLFVKKIILLLGDVCNCI